MKSVNTIIIILSLFFCTKIIAQTPSGISYQAIVKNNSNNVVPNKTINVRISIIQGSETGPILYVESHKPTTNSNGLFTITIGTGSVQNGSFSTIEWSSGPYFLKTEIDPTGGISFSLNGISQILSVPYAFHAKVADKLTQPLNEIDPLWSKSPTFRISEDTISKWNQAFSWGNHKSEGYITVEKDSSVINEIQSLSIVGNQLSISQGNTIILPSNNNGNPTGTILSFASATAPSGYLVCDGRAVSRTTYSDLFTVIGTTWGAGDSNTTFNLPDLRGRTQIGSGQGSSLTNRTLGQIGGAETHTLTIQEMPAHTHSLPSVNGGGNYKNGLNVVANTGNPTAPTMSEGGSQPHNNMQPFTVVTFIIKY